MNVLDLDVYMEVLYIVCAICRFCNSRCASYIVFYKKIIAQVNLQQLGKP
jgi:hypothetical protein